MQRTKIQKDKWIKEAARFKQDTIKISDSLKSGLYYGSRRLYLIKIRENAIAYKICLKNAGVL